MKARFCRGLILACLCMFAGTAAADDVALSTLMQQGKHHELIQVLQPQVSRGQDLSSFQLMLLTGAYYELRKYGDALETSQRLERRIKTGDSSFFGADLSVYPQIIQAAISLDQGLYEESIRYASTAYGRLKKDQHFYRAQLIQVSSLIGIASALSGRTSEARSSLEIIRNVDLAKSNLGPEKFTAMARIHMAFKEYDKALASINDRNAEVEARLASLYDPTFQNLPRAFIRAKSQFEFGLTKEARQGYDDLLGHPQIAQFGAIHWLALQDRARIALKDGDTSKAMDLFRKAIEIIERQRASIDSEAGRIGFVGDKQSVYAQLVALLIQQGRAEEAFSFVERSKSRALVDMLASKQDLGIKGANPDAARQALKELESLDRLAQERNPLNQGDQTSVLRSLRIAQQNIALKAPELASLVSVTALASSEVKSLMPAHEAVVEYYYQDPELYVFVLDGKRTQAIKLTGKGLREQVQAFRSALDQPPGDAWQPLSESLYRRLWQPIEAILGAQKSVVVVPHSVLHYLPFSALRSPSGKLLVDSYALRFLPSASVLRFIQSGEAAAQGVLLVFGNPDLGNPKLDLQFAEGEARSVAGLFPGSRMLLRREASESNFRKMAGAFKRIHFATHGKFNADAALRSGLYLAKDEGNDGVLTVGELYATLLNADLVTLSACETGLGKILNGDDIVGLTRGFLYAGSRSIVASLWSVDDEATALLMQSFYRNLAGMSKVEALRQAQISTRISFAHPFFWAAFQLTGRGD